MAGSHHVCALEDNGLSLICVNFWVVCCTAAVVIVMLSPCLDSQCITLCYFETDNAGGVALILGSLARSLVLSKLAISPISGILSS